MAGKKRKRQRGRRGEGYVTYDAARERWRCVVGPKSRYFPTESAAREQQRAWIEEAQRPVGQPAPRDRQAVTEALLEMLDSQDWVADTTHALRENYVLQISAHIGARAVGDVTPADVEALDRAMRAKYVGARARQIVALLATLYRRLMALRTITYDPVAAYLEITPSRARAGTPLQAAHPIDAGICRLILKQLDTHHAIIAWMIVLGLRSGEARGLRWANVRGDTVAIVEQRRPSDRHTPAPIKTERTIGRGRLLWLPPALLSLTPVIGDDLVFPNPRDSGAIDDSTIRRAFHAACAKARAPLIRLHDLRHTCATGLTMLGCPELIVRAQLGHAPATQTAEYIEVTPAMLRPWVEQWAGLVLGEGAERVSIDKRA